MQYYAAPMEGLTDRVWRQAQQKWFGPEGTAHRYYAPFLSPPENRVLIKKKMAELAPAANPGAPVIPQLLAKDGELAAWMIGELRALGYTEVNLNLGCPSGTVTAKGKGSGMLRDPAVLDAFYAHHCVLHSLKQYPADNAVGHASLVFELCYPESLRIVDEQGWLWRLLDFETDNPDTAAAFAAIRDELHRWLNAQSA